METMNTYEVRLVCICGHSRVLGTVQAPNPSKAKDVALDMEHWPDASEEQMKVFLVKAEQVHPAIAQVA